MRIGWIGWSTEDDHKMLPGGRERGEADEALLVVAAGFLATFAAAECPLSRYEQWKSFSFRLSAELFFARRHQP
jgi:hypothetical protein